MIPFGAKVVYHPSSASSVKQPKCAPNGRGGLFMGYHIQSGGRWAKGFYAADPEAARQSPPGTHVPSHHVKEVAVPPGEWEFSYSEREVAPPAPGEAWGLAGDVPGPAEGKKARAKNPSRS